MLRVALLSNIVYKLRRKIKQNPDDECHVGFFDRSESLLLGMRLSPGESRFYHNVCLNSTWGIERIIELGMVFLDEEMEFYFNGRNLIMNFIKAEKQGATRLPVDLQDIYYVNMTGFCEASELIKLEGSGLSNLNGSLSSTEPPFGSVPLSGPIAEIGPHNMSAQIEALRAELRELKVKLCFEATAEMTEHRLIGIPKQNASSVVKAPSPQNTFWSAHSIYVQLAATR